MCTQRLETRCKHSSRDSNPLRRPILGPAPSGPHSLETNHEPVGDTPYSNNNTGHLPQRGSTPSPLTSNSPAPSVKASGRGEAPPPLRGGGEAGGVTERFIWVRSRTGVVNISFTPHTIAKVRHHYLPCFTTSAWSPWGPWDQVNWINIKVEG